MIKNIFFITTILLFTSCEKSEFENLLINPDKKWSYINNHKLNPNSRIIFYMKFHPNGDFENRYISNGHKHIFIDGQVKDCKWKYSEKESILELCDSKYKILKYKKDTIHLLTLKDNFKCLFINYQPKNKK